MKEDIENELKRSKWREEQEAPEKPLEVQNTLGRIDLNLNECMSPDRISTESICTESPVQRNQCPF